jgi:hypothetical protein
MQLLRLIAELFVIYLLFKLVFDFILPIYRASKQMNRKMKDFQEKANANRSNETGNEFQSKQKPPTDSKEYIDFEEIK